MTEPGEMDELRARLRRAEEDAAAARILAGGADRDVGELGREFRAFRDQNNRVLSAMREDLTDLRTRVDDGFARVDDAFARVDDAFARIDREFAQVDRNFLAVNSKIDGVAAGLRVITDLLTRRDDEEPPSR
jgi:archaellum component FlaC